MERKKQELVMRCLRENKTTEGTLKYRVSFSDGRLYSYRKAKGEYLPVVSNDIAGYQQIGLSLGRGKGVKVMVYVHVLVYLSLRGFYEEGMVIDHIDNDRSNNTGSNLQCITYSENKLKSPSVGTRKKYFRMTEKKYDRMLELYAEGFSKNEISKRLGVSRGAVIYRLKNAPERLT